MTQPVSVGANAPLWCRAKPRPFRSLLTGTHGLYGHTQLSNSSAEDTQMEVDHEDELGCGSESESEGVTVGLASGDVEEEEEDMPPSPTRMSGGLARGK